MNSIVFRLPDRFPQFLWLRKTCSLCTSIEFEVAEAQPLDGLLGFFALKPVRCLNCWRRYYWFVRKGESSI